MTDYVDPRIASREPIVHGGDVTAGTDDTDTIEEATMRPEAKELSCDEDHAELARGSAPNLDDLAEIVHDLKSPLAAIAHETEMLELDETADVDHAWLGRAVHRIVQNVSFLDRMFDDLLDMYAADTGRLALSRSRCELRGVVERVIAHAVPSNDRRRIVLRMPAPITVEIDEHRIERVIGNLVQNALEYSPQVSQVVVALSTNGSHVRLSVADRGPGIAPADQAALFGWYRRLPRAKQHDGSGLGLYISRWIVEAHGGQIAVESLQGRGSCFYFELPCP